MESKEVMNYADASMYEAEPMRKDKPGVYLLWMTEDPLAAIAAACRMYEGKPTYSLASITDDERQHYAQQVQKTHLKAPLEFVKFHFFIEGVDRAMTHQIVRQRTAVYAQESLRFAVKDNMADEAIIPPSILAAHTNIRNKFIDALHDIGAVYDYMIANGIPAEDARALLPHATSTRLHYCTDLRNLAEHSGNRLCTQAQFAWRKLFERIVAAIAGYNEHGQELVALNLFKPVCYQLGHCPFNADFDRGCTIRDRVQEFAQLGVVSDHWHDSYEESPDRNIQPEEWMLDARAAWQ